MMSETYEHINRKDLLQQFTAPEWTSKSNDNKIRAIMSYTNALCEDFDIPAIKVRLDPRFTRLNSRYDVKTNTVLISNDLFQENREAFQGPARKRPDMALCMMLTHEVIHARQQYLMKQGLYHSLDVSDTPYSQADMEGNDSVRIIRTVGDIFPHRTRMYTPAGPNFVGSGDPALFVYLYQPEEREAMSGSINIMRKLLPIFNETDFDNQLTDEDVLQMGQGRSENMIQVYSDMLDLTDDPDKDYKLSRMESDPEQYINDVCGQMADIYSDQPYVDPTMKAVVEMNARCFQTRNSKFQDKELVHQEIKKNQQIYPEKPEHFLSHNDRVRQAEEMQEKRVSMLPDQQNSDDFEK